MACSSKFKATKQQKLFSNALNLDIKKSKNGLGNFA